MMKTAILLMSVLTQSTFAAPYCHPGSKLEKVTSPRMSMLCMSGENGSGGLVPCTCDVQVSWCRNANGTVTNYLDTSNASNCTSASGSRALKPVKPAPGSENAFKQPGGNISAQGGLQIDTGKPKINAPAVPSKKATGSH